MGQQVVEGPIWASVALSTKRFGVHDLRIIIHLVFSTSDPSVTYQYFNSPMVSNIQQNVVLPSALRSMHSIRREEWERGRK